MNDISLRPRSRVRGVLGWMSQVVAWVVILGVIAVLAVAVLLPRVTGSTPYVILTSSMRPSMPPGTLVVSKPVDPTEVGIGDVVTYQVRSGDPTVVTHRVVAVGFTTTGEYVFTTQGDDNPLADNAPVRAVQVRGERWYAVPYLGYVTSFVTQGQRQLATYVVAGGLIAYALWMFAGAFRGRRAARPVGSPVGSHRAAG